MGYTVYLKKNEERQILAGRPWVYANEVFRIDGKDKNGALCNVRTMEGKFLGRGHMNHASKILVRLFLKEDEEDDEALYFSRIHAANLCRRELGYDNCYRAVFAEADGLPALIVDKYGDYLSVQILSLGMYLKKKEIVSALVREFAPKGILERSDVAVRKKEGLSEEVGVLYGDVPEKVLIEENGLKMEVDLYHGQKTGYFLDQKENRLALRRYARGDVLDCFCNSGGFSLNAALSANSVLSADVSPSALENVKRNAELNRLSNIQTVCGDVFELLRTFRAEHREFDTIVLDPPAFCKTVSEVRDACKGYFDINLSAFKLLKKGGHLVTCSCTHFVPLPLFQKTIENAAQRSGRRVTLLESRMQSPDHPVLFGAEETQYLKCLILRVD